MYAFPSMHTHPDWYPAIVELEMTGFQQFGFLKVNWARCRISSLLGLRCSYMYVSKWQWAPHDLSSGKKNETLKCCGKMIILHWFDYECDWWKYLVKANYPLSDDIFPYLPNNLVIFTMCHLAFEWKSINLDHSVFGFVQLLCFRICIFNLDDRCKRPQKISQEKSKKCTLCSAAIIQDWGFGVFRDPNAASLWFCQKERFNSTSAINWYVNQRGTKYEVFSAPVQFRLRWSQDATGNAKSGTSGRRLRRRKNKEEKWKLCKVLNHAKCRVFHIV